MALLAMILAPEYKRRHASASLCLRFSVYRRVGFFQEHTVAEIEPGAEALNATAEERLIRLPNAMWFFCCCCMQGCTRKREQCFIP